MKEIVIVGSGPVGSFMAVLCAHANFSVTVYEKREEFTRNINLKVQTGLFKEVVTTFSNLNIQSEFFEKFVEHLESTNNRILIKELETRFSTKAKAMGVAYITREVTSVDSLRQEHSPKNPIILDCTGRNSKLRVDAFGPDANNLITIPLQHAMYINFKAKIVGNLSLYQVIKHIKNVKLTEVVVGKKVDENGYSDVTIPAFITNDLARAFAWEFPDINKNPLNPFNTHRPISDEILFPISSLLGNLLLDGCQINFESVKVKQIVISCGYAQRRSRDNFVCLGDAAIYLAFFRSLNLGFKHALELFVKLSMFGELKIRQLKVLEQFHRDSKKLLNAIRVYATDAKNVYMVVTKVMFYGCYSYNMTDRTIERLTSPLGIYEWQISKTLKELNQKLCTWSNSLEAFEAVRSSDISHEMRANRDKSTFFDFGAWVINLNGMSFIKISEVSRAFSCKYSLYEQDFKFLLKCFKARKEAFGVSTTTNAELVMKIITNLLAVLPAKDLRLQEICEKRISSEEKLDLTYQSFLVRQQFGFKRSMTGLVVNKDVETSFINELIWNEINNIQTDFQLISF